MPLLAILAEMELRGIKLNLKGLKDLDKKLEKNLSDLAKKIYKEAGEIFNIGNQNEKTILENIKDTIPFFKDNIARTVLTT